VGHPETADATDRHLWWQLATTTVTVTPDLAGGNIPTPPKAAVRFCNFDRPNELESNATSLASLPTYLPLFFTYCQRMAQTLPVYLTKTRKIHSLGGVVQHEHD